MPHERRPTAPGLPGRAPRPLSRRRFARLAGGAGLALAVGGALEAAPAGAGLSWCRADPLITVNGKTGHVYVDSTEAMYASAAGPVALEVRIPPGSIASAAPLDDGFGHGYAISYAEDPGLKRGGDFTEVRVAALAPARDGSLPVRVTFHADAPNLKDSVKTGYANQWIPTGAVKI